jgi:hypothetical protein
VSALQHDRETARLLERLMEVVRPEFRGEVFHPPKDSPVFFRGECRIPTCPTAVSYVSGQLCRGHYVRWKLAARPGLDAWAASEDKRTRQRQVVTACAIRGCNRAGKAHGLCPRHLGPWARAGRPGLSGWVTRTPYCPPRPPGGAERDCGYPACRRWTDGPAFLFCGIHYVHWGRAGRPDTRDWLADLAHGSDPRVRLHDLGRQLRLEVQFGLQRRHDDAVRLTPARTVTGAVGWLRRSGVTSLLDWDEQAWRDFTRRPR